MNSAASAELVRHWVALYTRGLSDSARTARLDEIESDIWCQRQEGRQLGRTDGAVAGEILTRLVLGIAADVSWRLQQAGRKRPHHGVERRVTMGSRTVGLLAVFGGLASTIGIALLALAMQARPDELFWNVITDPTQRTLLAVSGVVGLLAMSAAIAGLPYVFIDRIDMGPVLVAVMAGLGGVLGLAGVGAAFILFVGGSATFMLSLARAHLMNPWIAVGHALPAAGWVVVLLVALTRNPLGWTIVPALFYPLSWIMIGAWVLRGLPHQEASSPMPGGA